MTKEAKIKKAKKSKIKLEIDSNKPKQRTDKWKKQRLGKWTGSQFKALMSCERGKSKLEWDDPNRLFSFGDTALKYIYQNAKERQTQRIVDLGEGTKAMRYGTAVEPLIQRWVKENLKHIGKYRDVGFKQFVGMESTGVSSDGVLRDKAKNVVAAVEIKACTNWDTHYDRTFEVMNSSSKDFWQVQGEMLAYGVDECYYVVAEPPSDMNEYLYHEGDLFDLYDQFVKECNPTYQKITASKEHQEALLKRLIIAEQTLHDWLASGGHLKDVFKETIEFFHENQDKLDLSKFNKYKVLLNDKTV